VHEGDGGEQVVLNLQQTQEKIHRHVRN
jgi:hypothetical protein